MSQMNLDRFDSRPVWIVSEDEHGPAADTAGGHRSMRVGDPFDRILGGHPRPDHST
jgi:hypothetical protein